MMADWVKVRRAAKLAAVRAAADAHLGDEEAATAEEAEVAEAAAQRPSWRATAAERVAIMAFKCLRS